MSKRTTIYVLFKEYPDPYGRGKSAPYIQDSSEYLDHPETLMQDWTDIFEVLNYFVYEQTNKYYDDENLRGLLDVAKICPDEYPMQYETILAEIQTLGLTPWLSNPCMKTDTYFFGKDEVTNDLLGDMAQRDNTYVPCVLLHKGAIAIPHGGLQIITSNGCLVLSTVNSIAELHNWLNDNRIPVRNYKFNPKHGDAHYKALYHTNRHGNLIKSAQLLTDTDNTDILLKKAVGETFEGDLWYYDETNSCFIYFENQGDTPQHEYHAYHLHPGDKNYDKINIEKLRIVQPQIP